MIHDTLALQEQSGVKTLSTKDLCAIFGETASGYQSWKDREEKKARKKQEELKTYGPKFNAIIKEYGFVPGKRGFRTALFRIYGDELGLKKIAQLMRAMGLHASDDPKRVYHSKDESMLPNYNHEAEAAPNLVQQNFRIAPRLIILTDITYMYFMNDDGSMQRFYVCAYYDAFTKEPLGWSTGLTQEQSLVDRAYRMMMDLHGHEFSGRGTPDCYVVVHTDQGSVYTSSDFSQLLEPDRFDHSCSRRGNSRDNAAIESFWARMKQRISLEIERCKDFETATKMVSGYMEAYRTVIYQEDLANLTPAEFFEYCMTGVYPLKEYFAVGAEDLRSSRELMEKNRASWEAKRKHARELAEKRKKENNAAVENGMLNTDPMLRVEKDLNKVEEHVAMQDKIVKKADAIIDYLEDKKVKALEDSHSLKDLKKEVEKAFVYTALQVSKPDYEKLKLIDTWSTDPQLAYHKKMKGLFYVQGQSPYDLFCKELTEEMCKNKLLRKKRVGRKKGACARSPRGRYCTTASFVPHGANAV